MSQLGQQNVFFGLGYAPNNAMSSAEGCNPVQQSNVSGFTPAQKAQFIQSQQNAQNMNRQRALQSMNAVYDEAKNRKKPESSIGVL